MSVNLFKEKDVTGAVLMTAVIFMIDLFSPLWYEAWVLYLIPLFFMYRSAKRPYLFSVVITLLIVAALFPHPDGVRLTHSAVNRITGILGGWGVSLLLMRLKRLEQQKDDFYAIVTHDIKSSLTAILGYAELLLTDERYKLGKDAKELISDIERSGHDILRLAEGFLDLSRLQSGKINLNKGLVEVAGLLREIHGYYEKRARDKKLELNLDLPENPVVCMLDKRYVELAVENLVENALKYTRAGSITLKAARQTEGGGDSIVISVSDTGPGISKEHMEKIFHKYYRSPRTAGVKGTGLGLAIVKEVADIHGGKVEVSCPDGVGCTFNLFLPAGSPNPQPGQLTDLKVN